MKLKQIILTLLVVAITTQPACLQVSETYEYALYTWSNEELPGEFLDLISLGVGYAFFNGAAREISYRDFDHSHLLKNCNKPMPKTILEAINTSETILFHTQEFVRYSIEERMKRNIVVRGGKPSFARPTQENIDNGTFTVFGHDLGFCASEQGYLIKFETARKIGVPRLAENTIVTNGRKIWVGFRK